ncbi:BglII/BstYI family type II restriction endonuclease [Sphingobacterium spiritivorum]|uniref:BglII/BstYI family type II restriction endonuclease n=1 Tax=Sphingobacterium spiritivorum TaxID=258 RepID=UPI003DA65172
MPITNLPQNIQNKYEINEFRHAVSILQYDFPQEFQDVVDVLNNFVLKKSDILAAGGRKSPIADKFDNYLYNRGWVEHKFDTALIIDGLQKDSPTHKIDCYKNRIALDIEWNNKDPFFDRDLNNFRLLHERDAISVGIIVTRCSNLQIIFNSLGKGSSYGASTTHMNKLLPRILGGSGGGCPILVFGITNNLYNPLL